MEMAMSEQLCGAKPFAVRRDMAAIGANVNEIKQIAVVLRGVLLICLILHLKMKNGGRWW